MIVLYQRGGAGDFTITQDGLTDEQCRVLFENAARLLTARSQMRAAEILRSVPFQVVEATNHFNDEFSVLYAVVPLDAYERIRRNQQNMTERQAFRQVAEVLGELGTYIRFIAVELALERSGPHVEQPALRITSEVVERALGDAQELLHATGATSGVDRVHTALHGYLREVCGDVNITTVEDASLTDLFRQIRETHPAFRELGPRSEDIVHILRALATILDSLNPLRNRASVAHPNQALLPEPEAMLAINAVRSILRYVDDKVHRHTTRESQRGRH
jgi:hypothetical protein